MSSQEYAKRHNLLGLCRSCVKPLAKGSTIFCEYHREKDRLRVKSNDKKLGVKLKSECFKKYGEICQCCGESVIQFLTLDHNQRNGNIHRKSLFKYNVGWRTYV